MALMIDDYYITSGGKALIYGRYLPSWTSFRGESIDNDPFSALMPKLTQYGHDVYMTLKCYNSLSDRNKGIARQRVHGLLNSRGAPTPERISECFTDVCRAIFPDPCKDVSCPDECVGVDKYDQVCQDGICVRGSLIEYNSEHCGYEPPSPIPEPIPGDEDGDNEYTQYAIAIGALIAAYLILR